MTAVDAEVLDFAVGLAEKAGRMAAQRFFAADFTVALKGDGSQVTEADQEIEAFVRQAILSRYPADEIQGEEWGTTEGSSGRRWIIDPIDGTWYFAGRIPLFGVQIAVEDESGPAVGVRNEPVARHLVYAGRGRGCRIRTGGPLRDERP